MDRAIDDLQENVNAVDATALIVSFDRAFAFFLAAAATLLLCLGAAFTPFIGTAKVTAGLVVLMFLTAVRYEKLHFAREHYIYLVFFLYMLIAMVWTQNIALAFNTLVPAFNFVLSITIYSTLTVKANRQATINGYFTGVLVGVVAFLVLTGYPFRYPSWYSYNSIATIFVFALFLTVLRAGYRRFKLPSVLFLMFFMGLLISTTSIKSNLGVVLGVFVAAVVFYRDAGKLLIRYSIPVAVLTGIALLLVVSNEAILASIDSGLTRIAIGLEVLQARDDVAGYGSFESRTTWIRYGIEKWLSNPVFGYGVEAFRADIGITSHNTAIDLLYNTGLIGFTLFYSVYVSVLLRIRSVSHKLEPHLRPLIFASIVCYMSITLSGTMHYNSMLAAVTGISIGLLNRQTR